MPQRSRLSVVLLLLRAVSVVLVTADGHAAPASPVVGTWQVVEWWVRDAKSGERQYPYGRQPAGYYVYDATGRLFVQVARTPPANRLGESAGARCRRTTCGACSNAMVPGSAPTPSTRRAASSPSTSSTTSPASLPAARATCPFRLDGDRLLLGDGTAWQVVLMRAY